MITGVTIGGYHCYDDLKMILASRDIGLPDVQTASIEIPGRDGALDLTEVLYGVRYDDRDIKLTFITSTDISSAEWPDFLSGIAAKLHGQKLEIIFDEDTDWYYYGRVGINKFETDCYRHKVTLDCECEPYKYAVDETVYTLTGSGTLTLTNDRMEVIPTVTVTDETTILCGSSSLALSAGTYTVPAYTLSEGDTTWTITTDGTVTVTYRQGRL